jgi:hypothetical protein
MEVDLLEEFRAEVLPTLQEALELGPLLSGKLAIQIPCDQAPEIVVRRVHARPPKDWI